MTDLLSGTEPAALALAGAAGAALGMVFFGGLWWTVERLADAARPARLFAASWCARHATAFGGFLLVAQGSAVRVLACLAGFLVARALVRRRLQPASPAEGSDAAHP